MWTHARPKFENFAAYGIVRGKIEKLVAVVAQVPASHFSRLQPVGADEPAGFEVANHEVVAERVKGVDIEAGSIGGGKSLAKFEIKDVVAEALAFD